MAEITKCQRFFTDNVKENQKELLEIGAIANRQLFDKISLGMPLPEQPIALYGEIFAAIFDVIVSKQANWDEFCLNIADMLKIGYTTTSSDDDEKSGNYMFQMEHVEKADVADTTDTEETDTVELCTQWNAANIKVQADVIKDVVGKAVTRISKLIEMETSSPEIIMPLFCIVHQVILNYIRLKRRDLGLTEYELNVAGLYTVICRETEDAEEVIEYEPLIASKLAMKDDSSASADE